VIETVFTLPVWAADGRFRLARDYPVVQGCLLFTAVIYVAVNLRLICCTPFSIPG